MTTNQPAVHNSRKIALTVGEVFDHLAAEYDQKFSNSLIGRAQREAVWKILTSKFKSGETVLELNCGTGVDARFLASRGISVFACDASQQMIAEAKKRVCHDLTMRPTTFFNLATEKIGELHPEQRFDGAFSNFSGLNCVQDLESFASSLTTLVRYRGHVLLCFSTRICLMEIIHYSLRGNWRKGFRRLKGTTVATLGDLQLPVYYPTLGQIRRCFAPHFTLRSFMGIGVAVPPSYFESWVRKHQKTFLFLCQLEVMIARLPLLRVTGDHMLLCFEKVSQC
jgi:ubiquinone/menaquinone biosynthesis C-methylase UbiE